MANIKGDNPKQQQHFDFLENLRLSGVTNMWGAAPYLATAFDSDFPCDKGHFGKNPESGKVLLEWMRRHDSAVD